jgi:hypothetical protein
VIFTLTSHVNPRNGEGVYRWLCVALVTRIVEVEGDHEQDDVYMVIFGRTYSERTRRRGWRRMMFDAQGRDVLSGGAYRLVCPD